MIRMKILVTGSTGFIGRHIANSLVVAGHDVLCVVRNRALASETFPYCTLIEIDFARASRAEDFFPHLAGVDTVINTVGIFTELGSQTFKALRSEEHTSELQSRENLVCRLLLEKKNAAQRMIAR